MRRRRPEKRQVLPDPVYNDILVTKFVNYVMECGKKGVAEKIFYGAMEMIKQKTKTLHSNHFSEFKTFVVTIYAKSVLYNCPLICLFFHIFYKLIRKCIIMIMYIKVETLN